MGASGGASAAALPEQDFLRVLAPFGDNSTLADFPLQIPARQVIWRWWAHRLFSNFADIRRLFSSQCLNWIDARCPPRRDQAGQHCDSHQHRRCARKRRRIERLGSIEH
jgi:hypothetical protein